MAKQFRQFVTRALATESAEKTLALVRVMLARFGGMAGLVDRWVLEIEAAKKHGERGAAIRAMTLPLRLLVAVEQMQRNELKQFGQVTEQLSDGELAAAEREAVLDLARERPAAVAAVLRQAGWQVVPAT